MIPFLSAPVYHILAIALLLQAPVPQHLFPPHSWIVEQQDVCNTCLDALWGFEEDAQGNPVYEKPVFHYKSEDALGRITGFLIRGHYYFQHKKTDFTVATSWYKDNDGALKTSADFKLRLEDYKFVDHAPLFELQWKGGYMIAATLVTNNVETEAAIAELGHISVAAKRSIQKTLERLIDYIEGRFK